MTYQAVNEWVMVINGSTLISTTDILVFSIIKPSKIKCQSNFACLSKQKISLTLSSTAELGSYCLQITEPRPKTIKMQQWKVSVIAYHAIW